MMVEKIGNGSEKTSGPREEQKGRQVTVTRVSHRVVIIGGT